MKYSEFEIIAKENGWEIDIIEELNKWVFVSKGGFEILISKFEQNYFDLYARRISEIKLNEEKSFIKACYELAETPIEDREEEQYYTVKLPFLNHENKKMSLRRSFTEPYWCTEFSSRFTEKEIKELDPRLWEFVVEVEDERD